MTRITRNSVLLVLIFALTAPSAFAFGGGGHDRDGMVIGLTLGHGWNSLQLTDGSGRERDTGDMSTFTGAFKLGWARSDNLVGFIGISGWTRSFYQNIAPASATNFNFLAEIYWYPTGGGFWGKGGIGSGSTDFWVNSYSDLNALSFKEGGFTYTLGAGYEFRVSDAMAFGLAYDYTKIDMGDFGEITGANTVNHVLGINLNWYQP